MKNFLRMTALWVALCLVAGLIPQVQMVSAAASPLYVLDYGAVADGVIAYSLAAYCLDRINKGTETMKVFAAQTLVHGYYAKQYFV